MSKKAGGTIRYNVGGRIFEVSRDIVNRHPTTILARTAFENRSSDPIFIDGNSERFSCVLDYLRTGRAILPSNVPRAAFLQDLNFYGFRDIDPNNVDAITVSADALEQVAKLGEYYKQDLKERDNEIARSERERDKEIDRIRKQRDGEIDMLRRKRSCSFVAYECFHEYIHKGILGPFWFDIHAGSNARLCFVNFNKNLLTETLAVCGLQYISHDWIDERVTLNVAKVPGKATKEN